MPAGQDELTSVIRLTSGYLDGALRRSAKKAALDVEDYINRRIASGGTDEEILDEIMQAVTGEDSGHIFGSFAGDVKQNISGAMNIAATQGALAEAKSEGIEMLRWQTVGKNICEDCAERHGEVDTAEAWEVRGMPGMFGSRCGSNCQCMLVPESVELEPIKVDG